MTGEFEFPLFRWLAIWQLFGVPFAVVLGPAVWQLVAVRHSIMRDREAADRTKAPEP